MRMRIRSRTSAYAILKRTIKHGSVFVCIALVSSALPALTGDVSASTASILPVPNRWVRGGQVRRVSTPSSDLYSMTGLNDRYRTPEIRLMRQTPEYWPVVERKIILRDSIIARGIRLIETKYVTVEGVQVVSAIYVDLTGSGIHLAPVLHGPDISPSNTVGTLTGSPETVETMATATNAIAGVNGDFFEIGDQPPTYLDQPTHLLQVHGKVISSGIRDGCGALYYSKSGRLSIGPAPLFSGAVMVKGGLKAPLSAINVVVAPDPTSQCTQRTHPLGLVLATSKWSSGETELDATDPVAELKVTSSDSYVVTKVSSAVRILPPQEGSTVALIGEGGLSRFVTSLRVGQKITISYHFTPSTGGSTVVGGGWLLVHGGSYVHPQPPSAPAAATVIGVNASGTEAVLAVFNGNHDGGSMGLTNMEMASWLRYSGMTDGLMMDGGGSSTLVSRMRIGGSMSVISRSDDGSPREVAECICLYASSKPAR